MHKPNELGEDYAVGRRLMTNFAVSEFLLIAGNLIARVCQREALLPAWAIVAIAWQQPAHGDFCHQLF